MTMMYTQFLSLLLLLLLMLVDILSLQKKEWTTTKNDRKSKENNDNNIMNNKNNSWMLAKKLKPPPPSVTTLGEAEGSEWWLQHEYLLENAWKEWNEETKKILPPLNASLINDNLRTKVYRTKLEPSIENELQVYKLWKEVIEHQVFSFDQWLTEDGIRAIRCHLDAIADSEIPIRRPNGMNRYGLLFDPTIPGGIVRTEVHDFLDTLVDNFIRPIGRMFFSSHVNKNDDAKYYAFTIRYSNTEDVQLNEHSDASVVSININLNLPEEDYSGSSIYFMTEEEGDGEVSQQKPRQRHELQFTPGMALIHRGMIRHGAMPISTGQRHNLVIWLYGKDGSVRFAPYELHERLSVEERWEDDFTAVCKSPEIVHHEYVMIRILILIFCKI